MVSWNKIFILSWPPPHLQLSRPRSSFSQSFYLFPLTGMHPCEALLECLDFTPRGLLRGWFTVGLCDRCTAPIWMFQKHWCLRRGVPGGLQFCHTCGSQSVDAFVIADNHTNRRIRAQTFLRQTAPAYMPAAFREASDDAAKDAPFWPLFALLKMRVLLGDDPNHPVVHGQWMRRWMEPSGWLVLSLGLMIYVVGYSNWVSSGIETAATIVGCALLPQLRHVVVWMVFRGVPAPLLSTSHAGLSLPHSATGVLWDVFQRIALLHWFPQHSSTYPYTPIANTLYATTRHLSSESSQQQDMGEQRYLRYLEQREQECRTRREQDAYSCAGCMRDVLPVWLGTWCIQPAISVRRSRTLGPRMCCIEYAHLCLRRTTGCPPRWLRYSLPIWTRRTRTWTRRTWTRRTWTRRTWTRRTRPRRTRPSPPRSLR